VRLTIKQSKELKKWFEVITPYTSVDYDLIVIFVCSIGIAMGVVLSFIVLIPFSEHFSSLGHVDPRDIVDALSTLGVLSSEQKEVQL